MSTASRVFVFLSLKLIVKKNYGRRFGRKNKFYPIQRRGVVKVRKERVGDKMKSPINVYE